MPDARAWERLAVLEERSSSQRTQITDLVDALQALTLEVTRIGQKLEHSVGFWGGIAFAFSLLGASVGAFSAVIAKRLAGVG